MPVFYLNNTQVEMVKEYKYLGTTVTNTGNFKLNEVNLKKKGLRATYLLIQSIKLTTKTSTAIKLYEKIVEPILTYNCEVALASIPKSWDYNRFIINMWQDGMEINRVCMNFRRELLGLPYKTSNIAIMSETGKYPHVMKVFPRVLA